MTRYYQEHCTEKKTVAVKTLQYALVSSRSGRGAVTLTPAPIGAKMFYIARRTRYIAENRITES